MTQKQIAASTLPEVVVASVIWLLFFFLTLSILTHVGTSRTDNSHLLLVEMELQACRDEAAKLAVDETAVRNYEWGEIELRKERYRDAVVRVWIRAVVGKEKREITYTYLLGEKQ